MNELTMEEIDELEELSVEEMICLAGSPNEWLNASQLNGGFDPRIINIGSKWYRVPVEFLKGN